MAVAFWRRARAGSELDRADRAGRHRAHRGRPAGPGEPAHPRAAGARACGPATASRRAAERLAALEVYLAALQAGWYYTPINWHFTAPEIAYIVRDSEAKAFFVHERFAGGRARPRPTRPGSRPAAGSATATCPGSPRSRTCCDGQPDQHARRPDGGRRHALHLGHHRPAQGRAPPAAGLDPDEAAELTALLLQLFGITAGPAERAPGHVAELPHRGHHVRRRRADAHGPHAGLHGQVGRRAGAGAGRAVPGAPTRTWCRPSSSGCCRCPRRPGAGTTCPRCAG